MDYEKLAKKILEFNKDRDWDQFHNLKDIAAALNIEASELQEIFLWKNQSQSNSLLHTNRDKIEEEIADIFNYLIIFCNKANIDLESALLAKIEKNAQKYPKEMAKGKSDKYTDLK